MSSDRLYKVLLAPRVTEKTTRVGEQGNQYVFRVAPDASKSEIRAAVEKLFSVRIPDGLHGAARLGAQPSAPVVVNVVTLTTDA